jgi:hypothetical protein
MRCLNNLNALGVRPWANLLHTDDGSNDGSNDRTPEMPKEAFLFMPTVSGDVSQWRAGAIRLEWERRSQPGPSACAS